MSSLHNNTVQETADKKPSYIFKVPHKKNFTVIDNNILYNKNLSAKATCYLCILLSFPDHWKINLEHLSSLKKDGIKAVKSAMTELKENGYVFYYQGKTEDGQFLKSIYIVSETPKTKEEIEEFKKSLPRAYFGLAANGLTQKGRLVNTNSSKTNSNKEQKREEDKPPQPTLPKNNLKKLINRTKEVKTSDEEHKKLEESLGVEVRDACYQILSDWKEDTPKSKWKKSDYRSILRWVATAHKEQKQRSAKATESSLKSVAPEISRDLTKIQEAHKEYNHWRSITNDGYKMNLGALNLDGEFMYDFKAPTYRYRITSQKYMDLLENKYQIPTGLKTKIKTILGM